DRGDLRVLEAQPLDRVLQLEVDAEVVAVQLQLVARPERVGRVDLQREAGDGTVDPELPVPVAVRVGLELDHRDTTAPAGGAGTLRGTARKHHTAGRAGGGGPESCSLLRETQCTTSAAPAKAWAPAPAAHRSVSASARS